MVSANVKLTDDEERAKGGCIGTETSSRSSSFGRAAGSAFPSWQANLAVPPSRNISLGFQSTAAHKRLNPVCDHVMPGVALRQFRAKPVGSPYNNHCYLIPRGPGDCQNGIFDLSGLHSATPNAKLTDDEERAKSARPETKG